MVEVAVRYLGKRLVCIVDGLFHHGVKQPGRKDERQHERGAGYEYGHEHCRVAIAEDRCVRANLEQVIVAHLLCTRVV